jgi:hypothetical protein
MKCSLCGGYVEWKGPLVNLTHTECHGCGAVNSQEVEDDAPDDDPCEYCADLLAVLAPVLDWYQSDEHPDRPTLDILRDIVADLQTDRAENLRYRPALESIRDTSVAMVDSLRCYPKGGTVILAEGPARIRDKACNALYPANAERTRGANQNQP